MSKPISLIVGLGNPGSRYELTRHNAGFWFVDLLARRFGGSFNANARFFGNICDAVIGAQRVRLLKPSTYMNESGRSVAAVSNFYRYSPAEILIAHDEIDLPVGTVRLKRGGGHGGHNGLRDIIPAVGGADFGRLRIGVGHPGSKDDVVDYVLRRSDGEEQAAMDAAIEKAIEFIELIVGGEFEKATNDLNRKKKKPKPEQDEPPPPSD